MLDKLKLTCLGLWPKMMMRKKKKTEEVAEEEEVEKEKLEEEIPSLVERVTRKLTLRLLKMPSQPFSDELLSISIEVS